MVASERACCGCFRIMLERERMRVAKDGRSIGT
jgi:hypothetical protein